MGLWVRVKKWLRFFLGLRLWVLGLMFRVEATVKRESSEALNPYFKEAVLPQPWVEPFSSSAAGETATSLPQLSVSLTQTDSSGDPVRVVEQGSGRATSAVGIAGLWFLKGRLLFFALLHFLYGLC